MNPHLYILYLELIQTNIFTQERIILEEGQGNVKFIANNLISAILINLSPL